VMTGSWGSWVVELKTGACGPSDLKSLLEFRSRHREFRPLLLCDREHMESAFDLPIAALPWNEYLLSGPPHMRSGRGGEP
jgi:hypothetical protein